MELPPPEGPPRVSSRPLSFWKEQISSALETRKRHEGWWEANLRAYAPDAKATPDSYGSAINTNRDFTVVERKKADLFYQRPEVTLQPSPLLEAPRPQIDPATGQPAVNPQTGQPVMTTDLPALQAHEQIVNELLGPDGIDAVLMAHQTLFDVLCPSGFGFTVMGYESATNPVETVDPMTGIPTVVDVPVHERIFWHHLSPKQALIPHDFTSTEWDRAPWLGFQFTLPLTAATRRRYQLPDDFKGVPPSPGEGQTFDHGQGQPSQRAGVITGVQLWYKSALFRDDVVHPEHLTELVLIDGLDDIALEQDCPCQAFDERGRLTPTSLVGFPIHPLSLRVMTDTPYVPSDCTMHRPLVNELNRFREDMVSYRDAQILRWSYNTDVLPPDALEKIVRAPIGGMIGLPGEAFAGEGPFKELPHGSMPRESFTSADYIDHDISRTSGVDATGAGVQSEQSVTATEVQTVQANANARLDFERGRVLQWYTKGVTKLSAFVQQYFPVESAAAIVGPPLAQVWDEWRKRAPATVAFTAMPDSALRVDQAVDRKQAQELYTYLANDPFIAKGRAKLLEKLLRKFHLDPTGIVVPPDPPKPEPPKLALSFKGEDLIGPQAPIVVEILAQQGIQISPQAIQQSQGLLLQAQQLQAAAEAEQQAQKGQTAHGGKAAPMESLDKHASQAGMGMQGIGGVTPQGGQSAAH